MGNFFYSNSSCEHRPYVKTTSYRPAPDRDDILICQYCKKERLVWTQLDEAKWRADHIIEAGNSTEAERGFY